LLYLSNGRHDDSSNLSVCEFRTDSISTLLGDAHSFVIKSEAYQILTLEAVSELTCCCPHRYQGGSKIIFFVSELKSNSVSNSKTKGTPYRRSAASLHVHSKTKQAGAEHPAMASVSKSKKEKKTICSHFRCQQASTEQLPMHVWLEISTWCDSATCTHQKLPRILQVPCSMHLEDVREYHYINSGLHEPVYDYFDYTEYCDYSSPGRNGSTSTTLYAAVTSSSGRTTTSTTYLD
jgi:hypothetical protein